MAKTGKMPNVNLLLLCLVILQVYSDTSVVMEGFPYRIYQNQDKNKTALFCPVKTSGNKFLDAYPPLGFFKMSNGDHACQPSKFIGENFVILGTSPKGFAKSFVNLNPALSLITTRNNQAVSSVMLNDFHWSTLEPYQEVVMAFYTVIKGRPSVVPDELSFAELAKLQSISLVARLYVSHQFPLETGIERWGAAKILSTDMVLRRTDTLFTLQLPLPSFTQEIILQVSPPSDYPTKPVIGGSYWATTGDKGYPPTTVFRVIGGVSILANWTSQNSLKNINGNSGIIPPKFVPMQVLQNKFAMEYGSFFFNGKPRNNQLKQTVTVPLSQLTEQIPS